MLNEHVFAENHKLQLIYNMDLNERWGGGQNSLGASLCAIISEKILAFLSKYFDYRVQPSFEIMPYGNKTGVVVVVSNSNVKHRDLEVLMACDEIRKEIENTHGIYLQNMEWSNDGDGGAPYVNVICGESNCGGRRPEVRLCGGTCLSKTLISPLWGAKVVGVWPLSSDATTTMARINAERKRREAEEKAAQLMQRESAFNYGVVGVSLYNTDWFHPKEQQAIFSLFNDPMDAEYVVALNKYFVQVSTAKPSYYVKAVHHMTGQMYFQKVDGVQALKAMFPHLCKQMRIEQPNGKMKCVEKHMLECWAKHAAHLVTQGTEFKPGQPTILKDSVRTDWSAATRPVHLNICPDFAYKIYMPRYTEQQLNVSGPKMDDGLITYMERLQRKPLEEKEYLELLLEHIFHVYCTGHTVLFWALNAYIFNIFENPCYRMGVALAISGLFGVGKSIFFQGLGEYGLGNGTLFNHFCGDGNRLAGQFAGYYKYCILALIDEAENSRREEEGQMKAAMTEKTRVSEQKFQDPEVSRLFMNFIMLGQRIAHRIYAGDRRVWAMECDPRAKERMTKPMRDKLAEACGCDESIGPLGIMQYIMWLKKNRTSLEKFDFKVQPYMTPFRKEKIMNDISVVYKWWRDILSSQVQPIKMNRSMEDQWDGRGDDSRGWTGETTWSILWHNFKNVCRGSRKNQTDFETELKKCVVIRQAPLVPGEPVLPHTERPLYFGCIPACWAQFNVFLKMGSVHESAESINGGVMEYEECSWFGDLFETHLKELRQRGVGEAPREFHGRCQLCSRSSLRWAQLTQQDIGALRVEALQTIEEEKRGVLPMVFYKQEGRAPRVNVPSRQDGQRGSQRGEDDGSDQDLYADAEDWEEQLRGAIDGGDLLSDSD